MLDCTHPLNLHMHASLWKSVNYMHVISYIFLSFEERIRQKLYAPSEYGSVAVHAHRTCKACRWIRMGLGVYVQL